MKKYLTLFFLLSTVLIQAQINSFDYGPPDAFVDKFMTDMGNGYVRKSPSLFLIDDQEDRLTMKLLASRLAKEGKELDVDNIKKHYAEYFQMPKSLLNISFLKRDSVEMEEYATLEDLSEESYKSNEIAKKYYPVYADYRKHRIESIAKKIKPEVLSSGMVRYSEPILSITYIYQVKAVEGNYIYLIVVANYNKEWKVAAMFNYKGN